MTKRCWKCEETKPDSEFNKNRDRGDGLQDRCRKCQKAHATTYRRRPAARANAQRYCHDNSAVTVERVSRWRRLNPERHLLQGAKKRAKAAGIPFAIKECDIVIPSHCPILGLRLQRGRGKHCSASPTLDRIRNQLGYVPGNVHVVSYRANMLKNDATPDELEAVLNFIRKA